MSARRKILSNLEGRVNPVNEMCTVAGLESEEARTELYKLLREGIVVVDYFHGLPMYKLSWKGHDLVRGKLELVVDNTAAVS